MSTAHRIKLCLLIFLLWLDFHYIFFEPSEVDSGSVSTSSLLSSSNTHPQLEEKTTNQTRKLLDLVSYNNTKIWLYDEEKKVCLGWYGFHECGDVNLWIWKLTDEGIQLQSVFDQNMCLGRSRLGGIKLRKCNQIEYFGKTIFWSYNIENGAFFSHGKISNLFGTVCLVNDDEHHQLTSSSSPSGTMTSETTAVLERCDVQFTSFTIIPLEDIVQQHQIHQHPGDSEAHNSHSQPAQSSFHITYDPFKLPDHGSWKCPTTKRDLPRNLDKHLGGVINGEGRQVLMGAGVFSKVVFGMKFNVYSVGWYVDAKAVQQDERFSSFYDQSYDTLKQSREFNTLMTKAGGYNRSLFIKLAMTLKKDMVLQGLVEELQISRQNAKLLLDAGKVYTNYECPEGMEIIFTWKQGGSNTNGNQEIVELRLGEMMIEIKENGLGEDFLYQYFREDDPVSEDARPLYIQNFPLLLRTGYRYEPSIPSSSTNVRNSESDTSQANIIGQDRSSTSSSKQTSLKQWKIYLDSLLIIKYHPEKEQYQLKMMIICYLLVVIIASLPSIVRQGKEVSKKVVKKIKNSSSYENFQTLRRNLSRSTSLLSFQSYSTSSVVPPPSSPFRIGNSVSPISSPVNAARACWRPSGDDFQSL